MPRVARTFLSHFQNTSDRPSGCPCEVVQSYSKTLSLQTFACKFCPRGHGFGALWLAYCEAQVKNDAFLQRRECTYRTPEGYFVAEADPVAFAAFDATFPPKKKEVRPGQLWQE